MKGEVITRALVATVVIAYVAQRSRPVQSPPPTAQREIDPTRWAHDGSQPVAQSVGNRMIEREVYAPERELHEALVFT